MKSLPCGLWGCTGYITFEEPIGDIPNRAMNQEKLVIWLSNGIVLNFWSLGMKLSFFVLIKRKFRIQFVGHHQKLNRTLSYACVILTLLFVGSSLTILMYLTPPDYRSSGKNLIVSPPLHPPLPMPSEPPTHPLPPRVPPPPPSPRVWIVSGSQEFWWCCQTHGRGGWKQPAPVVEVIQMG